MTEYDVLYEAFFRRIEQDRRFFNYLNLDADQSMQIAKERAIGLMHEACARIMFECPNGSVFGEYSDDDLAFGFDLTKKEIHLVSSLMYESYLARDIAKLKCLSVNCTSTDLRVFDPSNARNSFMQMYTAVVEANDLLLNAYRNSDENGKYLTIDFAAYDR